MNPFEYVLQDVPRYSFTGIRLIQSTDGAWLHSEEVLAALAAAYPADLAEAGKVLEGVTPGPWVEIHGDVFAPHRDLPVALVSIEDIPDARFIAWCREGVPALLARIAAQEAQLREIELRAASAIEHARASQFAAETTLAASEAKVAKLVGAMERIAATTTPPVTTPWTHSVAADTYWQMIDRMKFTARAAITEARNG